MQTTGNMTYTDNETYRHIHFAVMAIESGARKLGRMSDPKYGLQLMSDDYILENLIEELRKTQ